MSRTCYEVVHTNVFRGDIVETLDAASRTGRERCESSKCLLLSAASVTPCPRGKILLANQGFEVMHAIHRGVAQEDTCAIEAHYSRCVPVSPKFVNARTNRSVKNSISPRESSPYRTAYEHVPRAGRPNASAPPMNCSRQVCPVQLELGKTKTFCITS